MNGDLIRDPPEVDPGIPLSTEPVPVAVEPGLTVPPAAPIPTAAYDPAQAYDAAVASGDRRAINTAWSNLAAGGEGVSPARIYPPPEPIRPPTMFQLPQTTGGNEVVDLAQQFNMPIAQAAAAIQSQLRFQALRGYQQDIESGTPAERAMAKWGPALFTGIGGLGRYQRTPAMQSKVVNGQLWTINPVTGAATAVSPPKAEVFKEDPNENALIRQYTAAAIRYEQMEREGKIKPGEGFRAANRMRNDADVLIQRREARRRGAAPAAPGVSAPPPPPSAAPGAAQAPAEAFPEVPADKSKRVVGKTYRSSQGNFTWTGKGWRRYSP